MPLDQTDDKSTLVQVMAWCRQATSHYLSQCWHRFLSPNGATRPQWVNLLTPGKYGNDSTSVMFEPVYVLTSWTLHVKLPLGEGYRMPLIMSALVQAMAWCRQATSHYLSQCWLRSLSPYGISLGHNVSKNWSCHCNDLQWSPSPTSTKNDFEGSSEIYVFSVKIHMADL